LAIASRDRDDHAIASLAMRELPVSIAYPIWTAIGSLGTVFLGCALLGESLTALKLVSVGLIVAGVMGLK
jgi:quaternary ammonium compound-resistance protein SugE